MTFLQMLIALALERLMPHWMQYRIYHFYDDFLHWLGSLIPPRDGWQSYLLVFLSVGVPVLLVVLLQNLLGKILFGDFLLGLVLLFYCLGPKDLSAQVNLLLAAMEKRDEESARAACLDLAEWDDEDSMADRITKILESVSFLSLQRIFGVLFWFALLGPVGAILFRASQLVSSYYRREDQPTLDAAELMYLTIAWLPARMVALGYALSGHFTRSMETWIEKAEGERTYAADEVRDFLAKAGLAALDMPVRIVEEWEEGVLQLRDIMGLIWRTLILWLSLIALLTIGSWVN